MVTSGFKDSPDRFSLANELHARPFPSLEGHGQAVCLALRSKGTGADVRQAEFEHLTALLDRYGAEHPPKGANHHWAKLGKYKLKWERHTEFQTYTLFSDEASDDYFDLELDIFPSAWREATTGEIVTATRVQLVREKDVDFELIHKLFQRESLAVAEVLSGSAKVAGDFRIDGNGFVRFLVFADLETGPRRLGRIVQRIFEIETYRAMSMMSLPAARTVGADLQMLGTKLSDVVAGFATESADTDASLSQLLNISAHLEHLNARYASRFTAAEAYSKLVAQRIEVLREERIGGRQTFSEFMTRRYEPAIRTCASTYARLLSMSAQAARAGDMLRTRIDVARAVQNQEILARMDERAAQQLKLQKTVEGLSVVAVSYYAVNLAAYLITPFAAPLGLSKIALTALITVPIILLVWFMIRKIREKF